MKTTAPVSQSEGDPVGDLAFLHEEMIESYGSVLAVEFIEPEALLTGDASTAVVVDVVWSASDNPPRAGTRLQVTTPKGLLNTLTEDGELWGYVAVTGDSEAVSAGVVGPDGEFVVPDDDAQVLPLAANALARNGVPAAPGVRPDVCAGDVPGPERWEGDAAGALVEYFTRFADVSYLELTERTRNQEALVDRLFERAGSMPDAVTGVLGQADLNDLRNQLEEGASPDNVILRPAIPMLLTLPDDADATKAVVFVSAPSMRFLGSTSLRSVEDAQQTVIWIAPPVNDHSVQVHLRDDDFRAECIGSGSEPKVEIPTEAADGKTRVALDLVDWTYTEITELTEP